MEYISNENSIILAISPANHDIANSDALKFAREVDHRGERTFGVITKLDLMDEGTDACEMLQGRIYPLKLGYIGVVCRSQKDINNNKPISEALDAETKFFIGHPAYRKIAPGMGIKSLSLKLNQLLIRHVKKCLPQIKDKIQCSIVSKEQELESLGSTMEFEGDSGARAIMLHIVTKFIKKFCDYLEGHFVKESTDELKGGSRIHFIFHSTLFSTIE